MLVARQSTRSFNLNFSKVYFSAFSGPSVTTTILFPPSFKHSSNSLAPLFNTSEFSSAAFYLAVRIFKNSVVGVI